MMTAAPSLICASRSAARRTAWPGTRLAWAGSQPAVLPLIAENLILTDVPLTSKWAAIHHGVNHLRQQGRTNRPGRLYQELRRRELRGSTGVGWRIAIPHSQSAAMEADSLLIMKPRCPVPWDSADRQPVKVILLLALRPGGTAGNQIQSNHLHILARLARGLIQAEFRDLLEQAGDAVWLADRLGQILAASP